MIKRLAGFCLIACISAISWTAGGASAHQPSEFSWWFSCRGGNGSTNAGSCFQHHTNANARFFYEASIANAGYTQSTHNGYLEWDLTDGHEFNFTRYLTDNSNQYAHVSASSGTLCGQPTWNGCTTTGISGGHIVEATATIQLKSGRTFAQNDDTATHEFGHYLGLGHSGHSDATMWATAHSGKDSLADKDIAGRCQIYGHAHGYWGGSGNGC